MKNWFTLLIIALYVSTAFAQESVSRKPLPITPQRMKVDPKHPAPSKRANGSSVVRSLANACDTMDMLDFNTYSQVGYADIGVNGQTLDFQGSWNATQPQPYGTEITSYIDVNHQYLLSYAGAAFDTLAFQDYVNNVLFGYPQAHSTIYLDSIGVFMGIYGDTTAADGIMTHDSLLFSIYPIVGHLISTTPDTVVVLSGYAGLEPFFTGAGYLGYHQVGVNQQFNKGEGFFINVTYIAKDTSSHCTLSYTFPDSCGITADAAYPPNLITSEYLNNNQDIGSTFFGQVQGANNVYDGSNAASAYSIPGAPNNCTFVFYQNFEILPIINVCVDYGTTITASPAGGCPGTNINLTAAIYGSPAASTDYVPNELWTGNQMNYINTAFTFLSNTNFTYTWTGTPATLSSTTNSTTSFVMPATGNDTVGLTAFDGTNNATASLVIKNDAITLVVNGTQPFQLVCGGNLNVTTTDHGYTTGVTYLWKGLNLDTSSATASKLKISNPGTYTVTVSNSAGCSASDTFQVLYPSVSNTVSFTAPNPICENKPATFTNTSSNQAGWGAKWTFGDPANDSSIVISPTFTYTVPGSYHVELVMDSANCSFQAPIQTVIVNNSQETVCLSAVEDISFNNSISLLPNPSNGNVNIIINGIQGNLHIMIYNILGSEVYNYQANELQASFNKSFDFGNLANGTYLVKIQSGDQTAIKRLVITK